MLINSEHCYSFKIPSPPFLLLFLGDGWSEFQGGNWSVCLLFPHWPLSVSCGMHCCMLASSDGHGPPGTSSLIPHSVLVDLPQKGSEISELLFLPPAEGCRILWAWPQVHLQSGNFLKCTGFLGFTLRSFCRTYPLQLIFFLSSDSKSLNPWWGMESRYLAPMSSSSPFCLSLSEPHPLSQEGCWFPLSVLLHQVL